jgi:glycosyltransferase involved in cell wall biosynthesis
MLVFHTSFAFLLLAFNTRMKKAIVSVTNDLVTDQRVHKVCLVLVQTGYSVLLVGRKLPDSLVLSRTYETYRMHLLFRRTFLFYAEYNIRLFFFLLGKKTDLLVANDLDTLLPNYIVSKIKGTELVYDSHEYFTEVPELQQSAFKKAVWERIEQFIFPKLKHVFTVNQSIAEVYRNKYKVEVEVVRNMPLLNTIERNQKLKTRADLGLPAGQKIILMQGAGINIDRGAEEAVEAMQFVENAVLLMIGGGDVLHTLKKKVSDLKIREKVIFVDKLPYADLLHYTANADVGLTLDKDSNMNYRFSLPNKLFDYIHAGIPVLASPLPEIKKIMDQYQVGEMIENHRPEHIAKKMIAMLSDSDKLKVWKENAKIAARELCWENESKKLTTLYSSLV